MSAPQLPQLAALRALGDLIAEAVAAVLRAAARWAAQLREVMAAVRPVRVSPSTALMEAMAVALEAMAWQLRIPGPRVGRGDPTGDPPLIRGAVPT